MRTFKLVPLILLVAAGSARADRRNPLDGQPAIRHRVEMRKLRFEITPQFITSINQDYRHAVGGGGTLQFHIFDWLGVGVEGAAFANVNTALEDKVRSILPDERDPNTMPYAYPGPKPTLQIHDEHVVGMNALFSGYVQVTPFSGKFSLFSAAFFNYDLYVNLGIGAVNLTQKPRTFKVVPACGSNPAPTENCHPNPNVTDAKGNPETLGDPNTEDPSIFAGLKIAGQISVGMHMYFTDWIGLQLELRDYLVKMNPGGGDVNGDRHLTHDDETVTSNLFFGVGLTFMLPPRAKISR
jgi:outer membrane beta-barrel protein